MAEKLLSIAQIFYRGLQVNDGKLILHYPPDIELEKLGVLFQFETTNRSPQTVTVVTLGNHIDFPFNPPGNRKKPVFFTWLELSKLGYCIAPFARLEWNNQENTSFIIFSPGIYHPYTMLGDLNPESGFVTIPINLAKKRANRVTIAPTDARIFSLPVAGI